MKKAIILLIIALVVFVSYDSKLNVYSKERGFVVVREQGVVLPLGMATIKISSEPAMLIVNREAAKYFIIGITEW